MPMDCVECRVVEDDDEVRVRLSPVLLHARLFELDLAHATDHVLLDTLVHCTANGSLTSYA